MARIDSLRQQAYYNADAGVEYARFIIEHSASYDPLNSTSGSGKSAWPKGTNSPPPAAPATATGMASFQCVDDPQKGTATIIIESDGTNGYNIKSVGTIGSVTATINKVHVTGGAQVDQWT